MADSVFWISGPSLARLAIVLRPRGGDWLPRDTHAWRRAGLDVVVSLLEASEERELDLERESATAIESGLDFRAFPIPDRRVPPHHTVVQFAAQLVADLRTGRNVGLHCRQGIGRSGLMAAAILISEGADAATALETISAARGVVVPETEEQRQWIFEFASIVQDLEADV